MQNETERQRRLIMHTRVRLRRMRVDISSTDAVILALAEEIEEYRRKIKAMEEALDADTETRRPEKIES